MALVPVRDPSTLPQALPMFLGALSTETLPEPAYSYAAVSPGGRPPHPAGIYALRFCTVNAELSSVALLNFAAGRGLPSGFAAAAEAPVIQVADPLGAVIEYTGSNVTTESLGIYHVLVEMLEEGEWKWEGQGWAGSQLVTSTGVIPWEIGPALRT